MIRVPTEAMRERIADRRAAEAEALRHQIADAERVARAYEALALDLAERGRDAAGAEDSAGRHWLLADDLRDQLARVLDPDRAEEEAWAEVASIQEARIWTP